MTPNSHERTLHLPASGRVAALLAVLTLAMIVGLSQSENGLAVSDGPGVTELVEPGAALEPAERLALVEPAPVPLGEGELIFPLEPGSFCRIVTPFGGWSAASGSYSHSGIDIATDGGQNVYSVAAGVLTKRYANTPNAGWGWELYDEVADRTYKYYHLAADGNGFALGDTVEIGDVIGYVGNSGNSGGGDNYHVQFEVRLGETWRSVAVDPVPYLDFDSDVCEL